MAVVTLLATISGVVLVTLIPHPVAADSGGSCSATGSIAGCLGDRNGTIDVGGEIHRRGRQGHDSRPDDAGAINLEAEATTAYCAEPTVFGPKWAAAPGVRVGGLQETKASGAPWLEGPPPLA